MTYRGFKFLICPDCSKRGVHIRFASRGEDHYSCRYCGFFAYTGGDYEVDARNRSRIAQANPEVNL
jgi:hypothetical protein